MIRTYVQIGSGMSPVSQGSGDWVKYEDVKHLIDCARPEVRLSAKELDYSMRLHGRILILRERLKSTQLPDPQEITKELHALEWAVEKITTLAALFAPSATPRSAVIEECAKVCDQVYDETQKIASAVVKPATRKKELRHQAIGATCCAARLRALMNSPDGGKQT